MSAQPSACIDLATLEDLASGQPPSEAVAQHLSRCPLCAGALESARFARRFASVIAGHSSTDEARLPGLFGYEILGELGRGGQGVIYRADQVSSGRRVAVKVLHPEASKRSSGAIQRFAREVQIAGALEHPGIVRLYDAVKLDDGRDAIVMELVDGLPLDEWRADNPSLSARALLEVLAQVADAIGHAHQRGIIHRDLKPSNILIDASGRPKVLDFGVASWSGAGASAVALTQAGRFTGTLAYAAPEQVAQHAAAPDVRTDIYSLGVIGYELLAGQRPYSVDGSLESAVDAILSADPPRRIDSGLDADPWTVLAKAMAKDPDRRYQSAAELARDLRAAARGDAIAARADSRWYAIRKAARRHRVAISLVGVVLAALSSLVVVFASGVARLDESLHESRLRLLRAHATSDSRERAESVLFAEFDRLGIEPRDPAASLWDAPLRERALVWRFVELQALGPCLRVERHAAAETMGLSRRDDGRTQLITGDRRIASVEIERELTITPGPALPEGATSALPTPSGSHAVVTLPGSLMLMESASGREQARLALEPAFDPPWSLLVANWGVSIGSRDGRLRVYTIPELRLLGEYEPSAGPQAPWLDPSRPRIAMALVNGIEIIDLASGKAARVPAPVSSPSWEDGFPLVVLDEARGVAMVSHAGGLIAWSLDGVRTLMQTGGYRHRIGIDRDSALLAASASGDPSLRLWSTDDWQPRESLGGHRGAVVSWAVADRGARILTTDSAGTLRIWAGPGHGLVRSVADADRPVHQLAIGAADDDIILPGAAGETRDMVRAAASREANLVALAPLGGSVELHRLSMPVGDPLAVIEVPAGHTIAGLRFAPRDGRLAIACAEGIVLIVDSGRVRSIALPDGGAVSDVSWSPRGDRLALSRRDGSLAIVDVESGASRELRVSPAQLRAVLWLASGEIALAGDGGRLVMVDPARDRVRSSAPISEHSLFALTADARGVVVLVGDRAGMITAIDARSLIDLAQFRAGGSVMAMELTKGGDLLVAAIGRPIQRCRFGWAASALPAVRPPVGMAMREGS